MANILLVVANGSSPTAGDALHKSLLESQGHTVTYRNDEAAEDITGMDGVVISESPSSGTIGAKYTTVAIPVVSFEDGNWDDLQMTDAAFTLNVNALDITETAHPVADGPHGTFTGTVTIYSPGVSNAMKRTGNDASGAVRVISSGAQAVCLVAESGATLLTGTAPARRVLFGLRDVGMSSGNVTADAQNIVKNAYAWAFDTGGGAPTEKTLIPATESHTAQALTTRKRTTLTPATETAAAVILAFGGPQHVGLTPATETDTAQAVGFEQAQHVDLVPASETSSAASILANKTLDPVATTDTAQPLSFVKPIQKTLAPATETATARALSFGQTHRVDLAPAAETDAALGLTATKTIFVSLAPVAEADTAQPLAFSQAGASSIVPAAETDLAVPLSVTKTIFKTLVPASDLSTAAPFASTTKLSLAPAVETDTAPGLTTTRAVTLFPAAETSLALGLGFYETATLTPATEGDAALALTILGVVVPRRPARAPIGIIRAKGRIHV